MWKIKELHFDGNFITDRIIDTVELSVYDVKTLFLFTLDKIKEFDTDKIFNKDIVDKMIKNFKKYRLEE